MLSASGTLNRRVGITMAVSVASAVIFLLLYNAPGPQWLLRTVLWVACGGLW